MAEEAVVTPQVVGTESTVPENYNLLDDLQGAVESTTQETPADVSEVDAGDTETLETTEETTDEAAGSAIVDMLAEEYGDEARTFLAKYENDWQALRGLFNAAKHVSKRDEFAELGKQVAPYYREVVEYIQNRGQAPQQQQPAPQQQPQDTFPRTLSEFNELKSRVVGIDPTTGQAAWLPSATAPEKARYQELLQTVQKRQLEMVLNPEQAIGPVVDRLVQERLQQTLQQQQAQSWQFREQDEINKFDQANAQWLYVNKANGADGYTAVGNELVQKAQYLIQNGMAKIPALREAYQQVAAKYQQQSKPATPAKPQARKTPNVANPPAKGEELPDNIDNPIVLADYLRKHMGMTK